jgi:abhydrolase domain-containing protein 6
MKRLSKKTVLWSIAAIVVAGIVAGYFIAPPYLYKKAMEGLRKNAGLAVKSQSIPDFKIVYLEGGSGDTILMLHGFGANKDNWLRFARHFTPNYRVIIPDLPGFGESSKPENAQYSIPAQVERLHLLVRELKLKKYHIVGNSMGGAIASLYAETYPDEVKTLALFDAAGVRSPVKSKRELMLEKGVNLFIIKNTDDYEKLLELNFYKPIRIPYLIKSYLAGEAVKDAPHNAKIFADIVGSNFYAFEEKLSLIKAPTLIVWGDSDAVLDISSVPVFEKKIPNAKTAIIKECGHLPILEKPAETAAVYGDFLKGKN